MSKMIKTTDADMRINTTTIEVVEINGIRFEHDEQLCEIQVYATNSDCTEKDLVDTIEEDLENPVIGFEDLKRVVLNWYFNNVEIVKEINKGDK
ncbi:MAG TPA: hypothetical protein DDZ33_05890 [Clostridium sp.]|uniref:hypothetical protein n=1 Tax=Clostridium sp. UBA3061 TaxID=1946353 RepID=UPI000E7EBF32|nr:hypothetical protein [Clostridium sp.]